MCIRDRSIAERIGEPFRKRNVGYGSSKTVQHDVAKLLQKSEMRKNMVCLLYTSQQPGDIFGANVAFGL